MTGQLRINEHGELEPVTWDGEPLYSRETTREMNAGHLFDAAAFEQMPGQTAMSGVDEAAFSEALERSYLGEAADWPRERRSR